MAAAVGVAAPLCGPFGATFGGAYCPLCCGSVGRDPVTTADALEFHARRCAALKEQLQGSNTRPTWAAWATALNARRLLLFEQVLDPTVALSVESLLSPKQFVATRVAFYCADCSYVFQKRDGALAHTERDAAHVPVQVMMDVLAYDLAGRLVARPDRLPLGLLPAGMVDRLRRARPRDAQMDECEGACEPPPPKQARYQFVAQNKVDSPRTFPLRVPAISRMSMLSSRLVPAERQALRYYDSAFDALAAYWATGGREDISKSLVTWRTLPEDCNNETELYWLIKGADWWLDYEARDYATVLPATIRAKLVLVGVYAEMDSIVNRVRPYTPRVELPVELLRDLLRFMWRSSEITELELPVLKAHIVQAMSEPDPAQAIAKKGIVPDLLLRLQLTAKDTAISASVLELFICSLGLRERPKGKPIDAELQTYDYKNLVSVTVLKNRVTELLSLLRLASCSVLACQPTDLDEVAADVAGKLNQSLVLSNVAKLIGALRRSSSELNPAEGGLLLPLTNDVQVNNTLYRHSVTRHLRDKLVQAASNALLIMGVSQESLERILDVNSDVRFNRSEGGMWTLACEPSLADGTGLDTTDILNEIGAATNANANANAENSLRAALAAAMLVLGGGEVRGQELLRISTASVFFMGPFFAYQTVSHKNGGQLTSAAPPVLHFLDRVTSRVAGLYLCISTAAEDDEGGGANTETAAVERLFDADITPLMLLTLSQLYGVPVTLHDIRLVCATLVNHLEYVAFQIEMPSSDGYEPVKRVLMKLFGHGLSAHREAYGSHVSINYLKATLMYQSIFADGKEPTASPLFDGADLGAVTQQRALRQLSALLNVPAATWRPGQWEMLQPFLRGASVNACIPCGHGKSMLWLLPPVLALDQGRRLGCILVIVPYVSLLSNHCTEALEVLGDLPVSVEGVSLRMLTPEVKERLREGVLPSILFLTVDAFAACADLLLELCNSGLVARFVVDEAHLVIQESSWRHAWETVLGLARFGVAIGAVSASLPPSLRRLLVARLGVVTDSCFVDAGFDVGRPALEVIRCDDDCGLAAADAVRELLAHQHVVHVLARTVAIAQATAASLEQTSPGAVLLVTGESPTADKMQHITSWRTDSAFRVFVATTAALVGLNCDRVTACVLAGLPHNVLAAVQAIGRVRPPVRVGAERPIVPVKMVIAALDGPQQRALRDEQAGGIEAEMMDVLGNQETREAAVMLLSEKGMSWLAAGSHCRLQALRHLHGYERNQADCGLCDWCVQQLQNSPLRQDAEAARTMLAEIENARVTVRALYDRATHLCICCFKLSCSQGGCIVANRCHRCGADSHPVARCDVKPQSIQRALSGRACFKCWHIEFGDEHGNCQGNDRFKARVLRAYLSVSRSTPKGHKLVNLCEFLSKLYRLPLPKFARVVCSPVASQTWMAEQLYSRVASR